MDNRIPVLLLIGLILVSGCTQEDGSPVSQNLSTESSQKIADEAHDPSKIIDTDIVYNEGSEKSQDPVFTHQIFNPGLVSHITPLGELNGGYEEAQTIAGVMVNLKTEAIEGGKEIEVRAPTDMTLEKYAYYKFGSEPNGWVLIFRISPEIELKIDHITRVPQKTIDATTTIPKQSSAEEYIKNKLFFKAGDIIAYTSGTSQAHNWNIYLTDSRNSNSFINIDRYLSDGAGNRMLRARCPFDFYPNGMKEMFLDLMGYNKAGQSKTCGDVSKDVSGTLSGMWHLSEDTKTGTATQLDGVYASPFSVFKNSAGEIIIHQVDNRRLDIQPNEKTNKDPKQITSEHCYQLENKYAYFKVISSYEMKFSYGSGNCPETLPQAAKTYYR